MATKLYDVTKVDWFTLTGFGMDDRHETIKPFMTGVTKEHVERALTRLGRSLQNDGWTVETVYGQTLRATAHGALYEQVICPVIEYHVTVSDQLAPESKADNVALPF